jgi:threonine synthase
MADVEYDLDTARVRDESNPLLRFFDLLPVRSEKSLRWLGDGNTPTVHARALGKALGLDKIYLKDETKNPSRTTKDRMASVVLSHFQDLGIQEFACSSTGNSSTSLARGVERLGDFRLHVFVGRDFLSRMNFDSSARIKVYWVRDATFAEAHECAKIFATSTPGITGEGGFFNPARREGLKMAFMEGVLAMPEAPHWYFQAASSGMGVYGTWRAAQQLCQLGLLDRLPRLACIQQETCAPMVASWRAGSPITRPEDVVHEPRGIAEAILRGNPTNTYPHLQALVRQSGGTFESVSEPEIRDAQRMVGELEGIEICASSATTVAALRKMSAREQVRRDEVVLVNLTGADRVGDITPSKFVTVTKAEILGTAARGPARAARPDLHSEIVPSLPSVTFPRPTDNPEGGNSTSGN